MSNRVLYLPLNEKGRDFIVGDIHGMFHLLDQALEEVQFDPAVDRLISVGDLINKGPHPERCLEFLEKPWFFAVRGNHEGWFIRDFKNGLLPVTEDTAPLLKRFKWVFNQSAQKVGDMRDAFDALPFAIEFETKAGTFGVVHADIPFGMDWQTFKQKLEENDPDVLYTAVMGRERVNTGNTSGVSGLVREFSGHTAQTEGVTKLGNCFIVDTGAVYKVPGDESNSFGLTLLEAIADDAKITGAKPDKKRHLSVITA